MRVPGAPNGHATNRDPVNPDRPTYPYVTPRPATYNSPTTPAGTGRNHPSSTKKAALATGDPIGGVAVGGAEDTLAPFAGDHGAEVFRACVACHTLRADATHRAGPTLAGIFGRRIASLPGYRYSEALRKLDIVWTPATVAKLFEVGPATYTPGTKMPEQKIGSAEDREALVKFLEKATKP